ncbi:MAG: hypothetical protein KDI12_20335, partial [Anaerolineae bacterium]|nr:hypothetical protein [Anaerolineae bacterium]
MRHLLSKPSRILSLLVASLFLLALPTVLVLARSDGPTDTLSKAWRRAASLASYTFDSGVVQSVHPTARLENVGRQTTTRTLQVQGAMDQRAETMNLHIAG